MSNVADSGNIERGSFRLLNVYSFKGSASRTEFWLIALTTKLLALGLILAITRDRVGQGFDAAAFSTADSWAMGILCLIIWFAPFTAVVVRRLHDLALQLHF